MLWTNLSAYHWKRSPLFYECVYHIFTGLYLRCLCLKTQFYKARDHCQFVLTLRKQNQTKNIKKHSFFSEGPLKELCQSIEKKKLFFPTNIESTAVVLLSRSTLAIRVLLPLKKRLKAKRVEMDLHVKRVNRPHPPNFAKQRFSKQTNKAPSIK